VEPIGTEEEQAQEILRFFTKHKEEWRSFVSGLLPVSPQPPLLALAKFFVIRSNQPFDMRAYMKAQVEFIQAWLEGNFGTCTLEERQKLVSDWLRRNAQTHRDQIVLEQARRIELCWDRVEGGLKELLEGVVAGW